MKAQRRQQRHALSVPAPYEHGLTFGPLPSSEDRELLLPLLPPELPWTYLVTPLPAAYMLSLRAAERASPAALALLLKTYLPFVALWTGLPLRVATPHAALARSKHHWTWA
jgi:hypothetical protein